jgi:hypothetical protein
MTTSSPDYILIAALEQDIYGQTFHHASNRCACLHCRTARLRRASELNAQIERAMACAPHEHPGRIEILPRPRTGGAVI